MRWRAGLDFAYNDALGYLTACPTNVGTGMRASAMLHLPALVLGREHQPRSSRAVNKIGLAVRGLHGEGTEAMGNLFQVSNQTTLGEKEENIIVAVGQGDRADHRVTSKRRGRPSCRRSARCSWTRVGRAYGILCHAYSMNSKEALNFLSFIRLGVDLGFFPGEYRLPVDELFMETQPAHLQKNSQQKLSAEERDALRAEIVRNKLKTFPAPDMTPKETNRPSKGGTKDRLSSPEFEPAAPGQTRRSALPLPSHAAAPVVDPKTSVMTGMQELIARSMKDFREGTIIKGHILELRPREALVDIGYKSEGVISLSEFDDLDHVDVGDEVDVLLERLENDEGMVVLSREKALHRQNWEKIVAVFHGDGLIKGKVKSVVKGGLMVNIGVEAFLPGSQIDITPPKDFNQFVGNTYDFKIVKINDDRKNVVLSRRELIEAERNAKRQAFLDSVNVGDVVTGTVKNLTDFGAFIDLTGIDGLLHITDMTWGRLNHPSEMLKTGQEVTVKVLDINKEKERVSLGLKQLQSNPWDKIEERFPIGKRVAARSPTSCLTARSWNWKKASRASSTFPS